MSDRLPVTAEEWAKVPPLTVLEPDAIDLHHAGHTSLPPCPFCGSYPITMNSCRESTGIFQCMVQCTNHQCNGSLFYNAESRDAARKGAIERWAKRSPKLPD